MLINKQIDDRIEQAKADLSSAKDDVRRARDNLAAKKANEKANDTAFDTQNEIFDAGRMQAHFIRTISSNSNNISYFDFLKGFTNEIVRVLQDLKEDEDTATAPKTNFNHSIGDIINNGSIFLEDKNTQLLIKEAHSTMTLSNDEDISNLGTFTATFSKTFGINKNQNIKTQILKLYLFGLMLDNKIKACLRYGLSSNDAKTEVKDFFKCTERSKFDYDYIWKKMKVNLSKDHRKALEVFRFYNTLAGDQSTLLLENFNYENLYVLTFLKEVPYSGSRKDNLSLSDIAKQISKHLLAHGLIRVADKNNGQPYKGASNRQLPTILMSAPGIDTTTDTTFKFTYAPDLMSTDYKVPFDHDAIASMIECLDNSEESSDMLCYPLDDLLIA